MEQPQSCSSSGGVGLNNSLLRTAHAQIHCIKQWSNLKAARAQEELGKTGGCGYLVITRVEADLSSPCLVKPGH